MKKNDFDDIISGIDNLIPKNVVKTKIKKAPDDKKNAALISKPGELLVSKQFDGGLIKSIQIRAWGAVFDFYDDFLRFAKAYYSLKGEKCDYVYFFSFTPQYSHMTRKQTQYYLYWRECFRQGNAIRADLSYLLLYIYEIINLSGELLDPHEGVKLIARLWSDYRSSQPALDKYLSEWMADYCLAYSVECPFDIITPFMPEILRKATLPEFYLSSLDPQSAYLEYLIAMTGHDFRTGKYYRSHAEDFEKHILGAIGNCSSFMKQESFRTVSVIRDSYIGALCLYGNKRRMTVEYTLISEGCPSGSAQIQSAVRYAENLVRSGVGIRTSSNVGKLDDSVKSDIDSYFSDMISHFSKPTAELEKIADRRYEPKDRGFSKAEAEKIERDSRFAAELLEGNDETDLPSDGEVYRENILAQNSDLTEKVKGSEHREVVITSESKEDAGSKEDKEAIERGEKLSESAKQALEYIFDGESEKFESYALSVGGLPDAFVEEINYFAFLAIGDIVIEQDTDGRYTAIQDYREEIAEWLKK